MPIRVWTGGGATAQGGRARAAGRLAAGQGGRGVCLGRWMYLWRTNGVCGCGMRWIRVEVGAARMRGTIEVGLVGRWRLGVAKACLLGEV